MPSSTSTVVIAGSGIYGLTAALELRQRGHAVLLLDPGPLPHPLAASTDISKVIRMEYGADEDYMAAMEVALDRWRAWNGGGREPARRPDSHGAAGDRRSRDRCADSQRPDLRGRHGAAGGRLVDAAPAAGLAAPGGGGLPVDRDAGLPPQAGGSGAV